MQSGYSGYTASHWKPQSIRLSSFSLKTSLSLPFPPEAPDAFQKLPQSLTWVTLPAALGTGQAPRPLHTLTGGKTDT